MESVFLEILGGADRDQAEELQAELILSGEQFVTVRVTEPWAACTRWPPIDNTCDQGAVAIGPYGADLSPNVLACPPEACVQGLELCPEHRFAIKVPPRPHPGPVYLRLVTTTRDGNVQMSHPAEYTSKHADL